MDLVNNVYSKMPTDLWLLTDEQYAKLEATEKTKRSTDTQEDMIIESQLFKNVFCKYNVM